MKPDCIFTDMDGTVLGHSDYEYAPVLPVLEQLAKEGIPVVVNSSKTYAEIATWLEKLNLEPPFISENGGVIYLPSRAQVPIRAQVPAGNKQILGTPYPQIRAFMQQVREEFDWQFEGFGDMLVDRVVETTGLATEDAEQAMQREVTEPMLWHDSEESLEAFIQLAERIGLQVVRGGRFYHVMGQHDKAKAMNWLLTESGLLGQKQRENVCVVALGDGNNDRAMLEGADIAVVLPAGNFSSLEIDAKPDGYPKKVIYAQKAAPEGWAETVRRILEDLKGR
ncbi:HAD-IIB family hydrolase [Thiomicrorhabdus indica]|uniref:HAD-IIB family hydrolase n=1 Tax=Thiomicrorhabdus indica TaxID=2267253 RepID=UPI002AA6E4E1|nr:HAD-IIB family hydrolase [Thiomicrorhabdus indica]